MEYRALGATGIRVSVVSFGTGPVPALMTTAGKGERLAAVRRALDAGVTWFDTAASYGDGRSEAALGEALADAGRPSEVHVATKVRLLDEHLGCVRGSIRASLDASLARLRVERVTLLQLHNAVTQRRGEEPTSLTPEDVLGKGGVLEALQELREEGRVRHIGLTGIGDPAALREVIEGGAFETVQTPLHVLDPSAAGGDRPPAGGAPGESVLAACERRGVGFFAIRVYAGGALAGQPPSDHTRRTPFFPLELYRRDTRRSASLREALGVDAGALPEIALRFVLGHTGIASAILGFSAPEHVDAAVEAASAGPLDAEVLEAIERWRTCREGLPGIC